MNTGRLTDDLPQEGLLAGTLYTPSDFPPDAPLMHALGDREGPHSKSNEAEPTCLAL